MTTNSVLNKKDDQTAGFREVPGIGRVETTFNYLKYSRTDRFTQWTIKNFQTVLTNLLVSLRISTILDVGCGEGFILNHLSTKKIGQQLQGIDQSVTAVNLGRRLFPKLSLFIGDIYHLRYKDNSKDLVICSEVLEHLKNPEAAMKEIVRVTKKYIILSVPNEPFFCLKNLLRGKHIARLGNTPGHLNLWTSPSFSKFINRRGVKIISVKYPLPFTLVLAQKEK